MDKWNNQAAPNNNLSASDIEVSELANEHEFSEELSDGMERNENIEKLQNRKEK
ncbi:hypothetical protein [Bacillus sp. AK128]